MDSPTHPCKATVTLQFRTADHARIAADTLNVDEELQKNKVTRNVAVDGTRAILTLEASDERMLRLCLTGFMEMAKVVVATLDEFAPSPDMTA